MGRRPMRAFPNPIELVEFQQLSPHACWADLLYRILHSPSLPVRGAASPAAAPGGWVRLHSRIPYVKGNVQKGRAGREEEEA